MGCLLNQRGSPGIQKAQLAAASNWGHGAVHPHEPRLRRRRRGDHSDVYTPHRHGQDAPPGLGHGQRAELCGARPGGDVLDDCQGGGHRRLLEGHPRGVDARGVVHVLPAGPLRAAEEGVRGGQAGLAVYHEIRGGRRVGRPRLHRRQPLRHPQDEDDGVRDGSRIGRDGLVHLQQPGPHRLLQGHRCQHHARHCQ